MDLTCLLDMNKFNADIKLHLSYKVHLHLCLDVSQEDCYYIFQECHQPCPLECTILLFHSQVSKIILNKKEFNKRYLSSNVSTCHICFRIG